jgi:hypothetical protein
MLPLRTKVHSKPERQETCFTNFLYTTLYLWLNFTERIYFIKHKKKVFIFIEYISDASGYIGEISPLYHV